LKSFEIIKFSRMAVLHEVSPIFIVLVWGPVLCYVFPRHL
jgi:hypothetical protein